MRRKSWSGSYLFTWSALLSR